MREFSIAGFRSTCDRLAVSVRASAVSVHFKKALAKHPAAIRNAITAGQLLLMILFGIFAFDQASHSAYQKMQGTLVAQTASYDLWSENLDLLHWRALDSTLTPESLPEIPPQSWGQIHAWVSIPSGILLLQRENSLEPAVLFGLSPKKQASPPLENIEWDYLGEGWNAFGKFFSPQNLNQFQRPILRPRTSGPSGDPREIRY